MVREFLPLFGRSFLVCFLDYSWVILVGFTNYVPNTIVTSWNIMCYKLICESCESKKCKISVGARMSRTRVRNLDAGVVVRGWNLDVGYWCPLFLIIFVVASRLQVEITECNMQSTKSSWENNEKLRRFRKNVGVFSDFLLRFVAKVLCFLGNLRSVFFTTR